MAGVTDVDVEIERARRYFGTGNFKKADGHYQVVLSQRPEDARVLCSVARIDAELGRTTFDDALSRIERLVALNPDDDRLPQNLVSILWRMGRKAECSRVRQEYIERFPDSPVAIQTMANWLQVDEEAKQRPDTPVRVWELYKRALTSGPLLTPCFRLSAYLAGMKAEPASADEALLGSSLLERSAIRSRALGFRKLFGVLMIGVVASGLSWRNHFAFSIEMQVLTFTWGTWCVYSNNLMCCKKCRNVWIFLVGYLSLVGAFLDHPKTWYIEASVAAFAVICALVTGNREMVWPSTNDSSRVDAVR